MSNQEDHVHNIIDELSDPALMSNYFTRTRRDKRFDGIVRQAMSCGQPVGQLYIDRMAGRYSDRLLALRGETIARSKLRLT